MTAETRFSTRRQVCLGVLACAVVGAASAARAAPPTAAPASLTGDALVAAGIGAWTRLIGTSFLVEGEGGTTHFRLIKVEPEGGWARPRQIGRPEPFTLYFDAPAGTTAVKGDNSYRFLNAAIGTFKLFVSGGTAAATATRFVAIMN